MAASVVGIESGSRFIKQQNGRVFEKGARDSYPLALADAQVSTALADEALVALGQAGDEFIGLRAPRRFTYFLRRSLRDRP